jgi:hypothetical protein
MGRVGLIGGIDCCADGVVRMAGSGEQADEGDAGKRDNDRCSIQNRREAGTALPAGANLPGGLRANPSFSRLCRNAGRMEVEHGHRGSDLFRMPGC